MIPARVPEARKKMRRRSLSRYQNRVLLMRTGSGAAGMGAGGLGTFERGMLIVGGKHRK
jgi:hypothetical protein